MAYPPTSRAISLLGNFGQRRADAARARGARQASIWGTAGDTVSGVLGQLAQLRMYEPYRRQAEQAARAQEQRNEGVDEFAAFNDPTRVGPPAPLRNPHAVEMHRQQQMGDEQLASARQGREANEQALGAAKMSEIMGSYVPKIEAAARSPEQWPTLRAEMVQAAAQVSSERGEMLERQLPQQMDGEGLQHMALTLTNTLQNMPLLEASTNALAQVARMTIEHPPVDLGEYAKAIEPVFAAVGAMARTGAEWDQIEAGLLQQFGDHPLIRGFVAMAESTPDPIKFVQDMASDQDWMQQVLDANATQDGYPGAVVLSKRGDTSFHRYPDRVTPESLQEQGERRLRLGSEAAGRTDEAAASDALTAFQVGGGQRRLPASGQVTVRMMDGQQQMMDVESMTPQERVQLEAAWQAGVVEVAFPIPGAEEATDPFDLGALMGR